VGKRFLSQTIGKTIFGRKRKKKSCGHFKKGIRTKQWGTFEMI